MKEKRSGLKEVDAWGGRGLRFIQPLTTSIPPNTTAWQASLY